MNNFQYYAPTRVVFGKGTESQVGELVKAQGGTKALVHFGGKSAKSSGLLDRVLAALDGAGVAHVELGGVVPNPRLSKVREGIQLCRTEGVDFLLAVGGGSVIDSCKAIGFGLRYDGDVWDLFCGKAKPIACAPVGSVLTIAAAGSEMSDSCVITNEEGGYKRAVGSDLCRPRFAVMNPELTFTLPAYQTASGCVDILYHTMERYFSGTETVEPTDSMAEGLMRSVLELAPRAIKNPTDYQARAGIMWAGSLSHNNLTGCGRGGHGRVGDWASHQLEHELSGMFDVTHGAGLAAVWGGWSRYVMPMGPQRFARFARNVMGVLDQGDDTETALTGIAAFEEFLWSIGMPTNIRGLGIELDEDTIDKLAWMCTFEGKRTVGSFRVLELEDIKAVYRMAR
jgi:hypothetical protein